MQGLSDCTKIYESIKENNRFIIEAIKERQKEVSMLRHMTENILRNALIPLGLVCHVKYVNYFKIEVVKPDGDSFVINVFLNMVKILENDVFYEKNGEKTSLDLLDVFLGIDDALSISNKIKKIVMRYLDVTPEN